MKAVYKTWICTDAFQVHQDVPSLKCQATRKKNVVENSRAQICLLSSPLHIHSFTMNLSLSTSKSRPAGESIFNSVLSAKLDKYEKATSPLALDKQ